MCRDIGVDVLDCVHRAVVGNSNQIKSNSHTLKIIHQTYACEVWDPHLDKDIKLIEKVQKFASRVCLKQWNSSYSDMLTTLNIPSLKDRRKWAKLSTLYKIVHGFADYPSPPLLPRTTPYNSRWVHDFSFERPFARSTQSFYSFFPFTVSLWNIYLIMLYPVDLLLLLSITSWVFASISFCSYFIHPLPCMYVCRQKHQKKSTGTVLSYSLNKNGCLFYNSAAY